MTKSEMISSLASSTGLSGVEIKKVLAEYENLLFKELRSNKVFAILDVGKLKIKHRNARQGRNPLTGQPINIPAKDVIKFSASKKVKELVNKK